MKSNTIAFIVLGILTIISSCTFNPGFNDAPEISFIGFSKDTLSQTNLFGDSLFIELSFRDGDGDLGTRPQESNRNVFVTDSRTGQLYSAYKVPEFPSQGNEAGIEGTMILKLFSTCCLFPDSTDPCAASTTFPTNDLVLEIVMEDDAGNTSNTITSSAIVLLCN